MSTSASERRRILVVDDDPQGLDSCRKILEFAGYDVEVARDGRAALDFLRASEGETISAVLTDVRMPQMTGLEFLEALSVISYRVPVVLMTAFGTVHDAVWAMKLGAVDFLSKPFRKKQLLDAVEAALRRTRQDKASEGSPLMHALEDKLLRVAGTQATVLVQGESGVGKERVAREIHRRSPRASRPFVAINCAAIPENLLESELFGFERGAFSGADHAKPGLFEMASGGTLLLDEVGDMPLSVQAKLLRVLQEGEIRRLGATRSVRVDVRIVAATHRDLRVEVERGSFRQDLLYRLEVVVLRVPSLRERRAEIPTIAEQLLRDFAVRHAKPAIRLTDEAGRALLAHDWPGNVRELSNAIERAVVLSAGDAIEVSDLPESVIDSFLRTQSVSSDQPLEVTELSGSVSIPLGTSLKDVEKLLIRRTLEATDGDKTMTARLLGVTSRTIYRKLDRREDADA